MDLVYGKCVQTSVLGFFIGGGFHFWQHLDASMRGFRIPPLNSDLTTTTTTTSNQPQPQLGRDLSSSSPLGKTVFSPTQHQHLSPSPTSIAASSSSVLPLPPVIWRTVVLESISEGLRTSKILVAATAASGIVSFLQHGRYSERLYSLRGDPFATGAGAGAAVYAYMPSSGAPLHRIGASFIAAIVFGGIAGLVRK